ncbi:MAG TPA: IS701 family transposase [Actinoplanes sp.]|nr:IS701 family transposase [Actinoplanes sp.]
MLAGLTRSDQRRAGEAYLRGLLQCMGRKSIRNISGYLAGDQGQSLQQFVNHSPWPPACVRRRTLHVLENMVKPVAWIVDEIAFPKNGRHSVGVERQYVRALGRICNCQLATVIGLAWAETCVPVNWRLVIPGSWNADTARRSRARVPAAEGSRPYWQYQVEALDDMSQDWGMSPAPVITDARQLHEAERLVAAFEARDLDYVARVDEAFRARALDRPEPRGPGCPSRVKDLVTRLGQVERQTVSWEDGGAHRLRRSQFVTLPVRPAATVSDTPRLLLVEWPLTKNQPVGYWITNIAHLPLAELTELARLHRPAGQRLVELAARAGLFDYEGRSFPGWHHHVTFVSAACAFLALEETT